MTRIADIINPRTNEVIRRVSIEDITPEEARNKVLVCTNANCRAPLTYVERKDMEDYFRSDAHIPGCEQARGGRTRMVGPREFDPFVIIDHVDRPIEPGPGFGPGPGPGPGGNGGVEPEEEPEDGMRDSAPRMIRNARQVYDYVREMHPDDIVGGMQVDSFYINPNNINDMRRAWSDGIKLVICERCGPNTINNFPSEEGYITLRDIYSENDDNALFFQIRIEENTHYKKLKDELWGNEEVRNPNKYIVLFANFRRVPNDYHHVFRAEINGNSYRFLATIR